MRICYDLFVLDLSKTKYTLIPTIISERESKSERERERERERE